MAFGRPHTFIVLCFAVPSVLNLSSKKKEFQSLVSNLSTIFLESTDPTTLSNCCRAIVSLAKGGHSRSDDALLVLKEIAGALRTRLLELLDATAKTKHAENDNDDSDDEDEMSRVDLKSSVSLCLRRLSVLSKRWSIADLLGDEVTVSDEELETTSKAVAHYLATELKARQIIYHRPETQGDTDQFEVPMIWTAGDESIHSVVAESVPEGLGFLMTTTAWRLKKEIERIDEGNDEYDDEEIKDHVVIRMRDSMRNLILLCYEQFIASSDSEEFSEVHEEFAVAVQEHALRISGDLRGLFPRKWSTAESPFLSACALTDDSTLIEAGVRFVRSQEFRVSVESDQLKARRSTFLTGFFFLSCKIRTGEEGSEEKRQAIEYLLHPLARGLGTNWETGNRREAGAALAHISGSGKEAHDLVLSMSRVFKKVCKKDDVHELRCAMLSHCIPFHHSFCTARTCPFTRSSYGVPSPGL